MKNFLKNLTSITAVDILYYFILLLIIFVPFYRFIQGLLEFHTSLSPAMTFWLVHWYEPFIVMGVGFGIFRLIRDKHFRLNRSQIIACALIVFGIISSLFISKALNRGLEGFRFTLFPLLIYFFVSMISLPNQLKKKLVNTYLIITIIVASWALLERILPPNYWGVWGILDPANLSWFGNHSVSGILQSVSFIGGPNQLASFLLPAFFIAAFREQIPVSQNRKLFSWLRLIIVLIITLAIIFTFSRSALIGLIVGIITYAIFFMKKSRLKSLYLVSVLIVIFAMAVFLLYKSDGAIKDLVTHGASQSGHEVALARSVEEMKIRFSTPLVFLFGSGLGSAGPAVMKYGGDGIVSESWYLQLFLELGIFGTFLWLYFYIDSLLILLRRNQSALFLGALSVAVCALFLHTFADNPAVAYTLFILLGLYTGNNYDKKETRET